MRKGTITLIACAVVFGVSSTAHGQWLYWQGVQGDGGATPYTYQLMRANLDGSNIQVVASSSSPTFFLGAFRVAFDVSAGKVYWSEFTPPTRIRRANLDGTQAEDLITGDNQTFYDSFFALVLPAQAGKVPAIGAWGLAVLAAGVLVAGVLVAGAFVLQRGRVNQPPATARA